MAGEAKLLGADDKRRLIVNIVSEEASRCGGNKSHIRVIGVE